MTLGVTVEGRWVRFSAWTYIDMLVAREIFLDRDYRIPADLAPRTIADLGANTGISVRFLRVLYPAATIVAAEPDPANFERLAANVSGDGATSIVQAAVAPDHGRATFYAASEGWASSLEPRDDARVVDVATVTMSDLLVHVGGQRADLLKIDIEGGEWPLLEAGDVQDASDCLVGELHFDDRHTLADAKRLLADFDLTIHKQHGPFASFTARRRAGERDAVGRRPPVDSEGPR